jgi:hypothetical protein
MDLPVFRDVKPFALLGEVVNMVHFLWVLSNFCLLLAFPMLCTVPGGLLFLFL